MIRLTITISDRLERILVWPVLAYRQVRYGYAFRRIPLTWGKYAIVDPDDYWWLSKYKWHARKVRCGYYAARSRRVKAAKGKVQHIFMHRVVLQVPDDKFVDHVNRNGLDNRKANLRAATRSQNGMNRGKSTRRKYRSRYKGLSWHPQQKRWMVYIKAQGREIYAGHFGDEVTAAKAYDEAAKKYHGEFACLNFPD